MPRLEKILFEILSIIALLLTVFLAWFYLAIWKQPLGPPLQQQIPTPFGMPSTWTPNPDPTNPPLSTPENVSNSSTTSTPESLTTPAGQCGAHEPMFILVIGSDTRADNYLYGLADVIRLVRMDFVNPSVSVLEIPRDLWVEIPDIADNLNGQDHEKLNQAYLYGNSGFGYTNDPTGGAGLLSRTLTLNFGTRIDHYAAINMRTFTRIVDAVDGIDVTLPDTIDGRTADDTDERLLFVQGTHHLNGTEALTLARIRIEGTFSRADNQDRVVCALRERLTNTDVIPKIPNLIQSFSGAVQTSLSPEELSKIACLGTKVEPQNVIFTSFPQELFEQGRTYDPVFKKGVFTWKVDYDILRDYVQQFNDGIWPAAPATSEIHESEAHICQ